MTYLGFHLVFILPALGLVTLLAIRRRALSRKELLWLGAIALVALVYTTPWDNYLVATGVWGYGSDRVLGTIGWVPIEEYLFFLLQPFLTGIWFYALLGRGEWTVAARPPARLVGLALLVLLFVVGVLSLTRPGGRYLGLILVWALPVVIVQWGIGGQFLWAMRRVIGQGVLVPTVYLWICDRIAIGVGIWEISPQATTGWHLFGLPIEEAVFFFITNVMVVQGLALVRVPFALQFGARPSLSSSPTTSS